MQEINTAMLRKDGKMDVNVKPQKQMQLINEVAIVKFKKIISELIAWEINDGTGLCEHHPPLSTLCFNKRTRVKCKTSVTVESLNSFTDRAMKHLCTTTSSFNLLIMECRSKYSRMGAVNILNFYNISLEQKC